MVLSNDDSLYSAYHTHTWKCRPHIQILLLKKMRLCILPSFGLLLARFTSRSWATRACNLPNYHIAMTLPNTLFCGSIRQGFSFIGISATSYPNPVKRRRIKRDVRDKNEWTVDGNSNDKQNRNVLTSTTHSLEFSSSASAVTSGTTSTTIFFSCLAAAAFANA